MIPFVEFKKLTMNLSGRDWWYEHQAKYPNSSDLDDLSEPFREYVIKFVAALRSAKARVTIRSTRRNEIRAYLMHYSWDITNRSIPPQEVPKMPGVDIEWYHGDKDASLKGAREMFNLFNLAHRPSLRSNHIKGLAIDMNITWTGDLILGPLPNGGFEGISEGPKNGASNKRLHEIGREFGVIKLAKDPPHWSSNGR